MHNLHTLVPCITLAAFSSLTLAAQQVDTVTPQTATATAGQTTAAAPTAATMQLSPVNGELITKIDTKNAKSGQPVVVKTTQKATTADGVVIPKGSKILGHVTDVQPHSKQSPNSKVTLQFDQAQLKGGQTLPIKSVLESVAPAAGMANAGQVDPFGAGAPEATGATPAGSPTGAGPSGSAGMASTQSTQAPQTQGSNAPMMNHSAGNAPKAGTVVVTQGNIAIKTTAIPGVLIAANINGQPFSNASGALLGAKQNVHLDGGTQMVLAIADVPAPNAH